MSNITIITYGVTQHLEHNKNIMVILSFYYLLIKLRTAKTVLTSFTLFNFKYPTFSDNKNPV